MKSEVSSDLFTAFFLSVLGKIVEDNPETTNEKSQELGNMVGYRISDDFFSKCNLFSSIEPKQLEKYISLFFKTYFGVSINFKEESSKDNSTNKFIILDEEFLRFSGDCGCWFFSGVLNEVFGNLYSAVSFTVSEGRIMYLVKGAS